MSGVASAVSEVATSGTGCNVEKLILSSKSEQTSPIDVASAP